MGTCLLYGLSIPKKKYVDNFLILSTGTIEENYAAIDSSLKRKKSC
jgi:hypothetical protein